jgi:hypothetical protein
MAVPNQAAQLDNPSTNDYRIISPSAGKQMQLFRMFEERHYLTSRQ